MSIDSLDIKQWILFAQQDYDLVKAIIETHSPYPIPVTIVCYHCQQSVEKILKAYILAQGNTLTKTHDLKVLLEQCRRYSSDFDGFMAACTKLTTYITTSRYPSDTAIAEQDMTQSIQDAQIILEFTKSKLQELGFVPETEPPQN